MNNIKLLIPAAGKGTRAKLNYPKTLFKINNKPILINILNTLELIDDKPVIICSQSGKKKIQNSLKEYKKKAELIIQYKRLGMADAVLKFTNSKHFDSTDHILLIWSDIISPSKKNINLMVNRHLKQNNDFSFITMYQKKPYTLVKRNKKNEVVAIKEIKNAKVKPSFGERELGIFIFKKELLNLIKLNKKKIKINNEYSFLKAVELLKNAKYSIKGYKIGNLKDTYSFNDQKDIK